MPSESLSLSLYTTLKIRSGDGEASVDITAPPPLTRPHRRIAPLPLPPQAAHTAAHPRSLITVWFRPDPSPHQRCCTTVLTDDDLLHLSFPTTLVSRRWLRHSSNLAFLCCFRARNPPRLLGFYHTARQALSSQPQPSKLADVLRHRGRFTFGGASSANDSVVIFDCRSQLQATHCAAPLSRSPAASLHSSSLKQRLHQALQQPPPAINVDRVVLRFHGLIPKCQRPRAIDIQ
ncbi:Os11g0454675 [Oryza sativa Japonica Group]|uniref:Os11g0454675 protein n=1 Tax=Oryza sativa subsp. japonica TaxID=39947 RepID=A0A0P0Y1Y4_ORYSJ|nr:Os11g0454675 [Oryza sativa Japonica Group]